jgi:hypothetical protein
MGWAASREAESPADKNQTQEDVLGEVCILVSGDVDARR